MADLAAAGSDLVLAVVAAGGGVAVLRRSGTAGGTVGVGMLLVGFAAAFGVLRFGGIETLIPAHDGASRFASLVGIPLFGVGYASTFVPQHAQQVRSAAFVLLLIAGVLLIDHGWWRDAIGSLGLVVAVGSALVRKQGLGWAFGGAVAIALAGLAIGSEGQLLGIPRVLLFHCTLALGVGLMGRGAVEIDPAT